MNVLFSAFFSVHWKWTFRSLLSFPFSENDRFVLCIHFCSVKRMFCSFQLGEAPKVPQKWQKKAFLGSKVAQKWPKTRKWTEMNEKNERNVQKFFLQLNGLFSTFILNGRFFHCVHFRSVEMNVSFTAFISVQYKWTFCSLRSFPFSGNEPFVHCVHFRSVQMNVSFTAFISVH